MHKFITLWYEVNINRKKQNKVTLKNKPDNRKEDNKEIVFKCLHLKECICEILDIEHRSLTLKDMKLLDSILARETAYGSCVNLDLRNHEISDIYPLSLLKNLTSLGINSCHIRDFSPLNKIEAFTDLYVFPNLSKKIEDKMTDISSLSVLRGLEALHMISNHFVKDISSLSKLQYLNYLKFDASSVIDLSPLSELTNLKTLWILNFGSSDISALLNLKKLKELKLFHCKLNKEDREKISTALPKCDIYIHKTQLK